MSQKDQGNQAFKEGNYPLAIKFYTNALAENPSDHTILSNRAAAYQNSSQFAAALADAEKCIELNPSWGKGYQRKAMALQA
jgi:tetratricopeptide (TPR) repeat protein